MTDNQTTDPRHLTQTEQRVMDGALRRSVTIAPDPRDAEIDRLRIENARLAQQVAALKENTREVFASCEAEIARLRDVLGWAVRSDGVDREGAPTPWLSRALEALVTLAEPGSST